MRALFNLVVVLFLSTTTFCQSLNEKPKKNKIGIYYAICDFFDASETNWTIAVTRKKYTNNSNGNRVKKDVLMVPPTLGIQYTRNINPRNSARISALYYVFSYEYDKIEPGAVMRREYGMYSIGWLHKLLGNDKTSIYGVGEINYRNGFELVFIYRPYPWDIRSESLTLGDVGLSAGLKIERTLPFDFLISGEAKYARFIYRYSEGVDFFGQHKGTTPNTLTIKLGLSYQF